MNEALLQVLAEAFHAANSAASILRKASMVALPSGFLAAEMELVTAWEASLIASVFLEVILLLFERVLSLSFFRSFSLYLSQTLNHSLLMAEVPLLLRSPAKIVAFAVALFVLVV